MTYFWHFSTVSQYPIITVTTNFYEEILHSHFQGHFEFKVCPNNDIFFDPDQECFDRVRLTTGTDCFLSYLSTG